jgi:uncharacterized membrane protein YkvA (DUF1232 family)
MRSAGGRRGAMTRWRERARELGHEVLALSLACRDPRVPWPAKILAALVVAYALSPLDLIPDFIPVLGYLDDLIVVPLGVLLVRRLVPRQVLEDCRVRARAIASTPSSRVGAALVIALWVLLGAAATWLLVR